MAPYGPPCVRLPQGGACDRLTQTMTDAANLEADWELLAACGAPLLASGRLRVQPRQALLVAALRRTLAGGPRSARQRKSLRAVLQALRDHYPEVFRRHFQHSTPARRVLRSGEQEGEAIKLRRIALARLSAYL